MCTRLLPLLHCAAHAAPGAAAMLAHPPLPPRPRRPPRVAAKRAAWRQWSATVSWPKRAYAAAAGGRGPGAGVLCSMIRKPAGEGSLGSAAHCRGATGPTAQCVCHAGSVPSCPRQPPKQPCRRRRLSCRRRSQCCRGHRRCCPRRGRERRWCHPRRCRERRGGGRGGRRHRGRHRRQGCGQSP